MPKLVPWLFEVFIRRRLTPPQRAMRALLGELTLALDSSPHPEWNLRTRIRDDDVELEYRRVRRVYCRLEPRLIDDRGGKQAVVVVFVRGATAEELQPAGEVFSRKKTCLVVVSNKRGAKALASLIQRAWKSAFNVGSSVLEATGRPQVYPWWQQ
jgi:hypothetical protein